MSPSTKGPSLLPRLGSPAGSELTLGTWGLGAAGVTGLRPHPEFAPGLAITPECPAELGCHVAHREQGLALPTGADL